ncbi:type VI secretion system ATPase TssH [Amphritea pacifica]|uniref:type VI secretion system ATPase TssH n=1 Tax=Amphritea pacifica TaxID=2811233 RepID=UPI00196562C5|nr:type VI secretion system ATPase TssH [Amphritea pacifica]MBN1005370.1 type VI secretion system ATPase TssH [Amphritea pacifica]
MMEKIQLKSLVERLNSNCTRALEAAAGLCVSQEGYEVSVDHYLMKLLEEENDLARILVHYEINVVHFVKRIQHSIELDKKGHQGKPVFSSALVGLLEDAWLIASLELGAAEVRSGHLVMAILANQRRHGMASYVDDLSSVPYDDLKTHYQTVTEGSCEINQSTTKGTVASAVAEADLSVLDKYCTNLTAKARAGEIDPVFCRDVEIRQMIDILGRRRKNNPICVGDAGVGKSAVVEGLALKIAQGEVPDVLAGVELYGLDLGLLQAGASVKGEFENRLKGVINAIKSSPKPIVLFIDEAHTLIGAGGAAGSGDAANLLKPALARGELRTVAATTWSEYKKYFEKDPALARRFQLVKLDEPTVEQAVVIIRGLRQTYEAAHGVYVRDDAVEAAAKLSSRYISGRQLPDKAVDVLDTAAARVKISITAKPDAIDDLERMIQTLERELHALSRDISSDVLADEGQIDALALQIAAHQTELETLMLQWQSEQELVNTIVQLRQTLAQHRGQSVDADPEAETQLRQEISEKVAALNELQQDNPLIHYEVSPDVVGRVIADWTGIPLGKMVRDEAQSVLSFNQQLQQRIKGQNHAIDAIDQGVRAAKAGVNNPETPMGVFLFVGPSGVGKTEAAIGVADQLFGGERFLTSINMSEFQEKHSVSRLIGSPPGYVGYGEGGLLTEAVRQKPYSVVLLDEVEKADLEVMNLFYQVFDKGMLSDGEGQLVNFRNTIVFLTSNLATDIITDMCADGHRPSKEALIDAIRPVLSAHFKPALLARMQIVPFYPIAAEVMGDIVRIKLNKLVQRLASSQKLVLNYTDRVVETIALRCTEVETGARNIDHILNGTLLPQIATEVLERMTEETRYTHLLLDIDTHGEFTLSFSHEYNPPVADDVSDLLRAEEGAETAGVDTESAATEVPAND